ncbi:hypothetical protein AKJ56_00430 [candidate division MSBL1 archaeon SCGC-AAA382N08]|uniref:Uncharacterized protein n=1 Tax=candidate division MSBL1 archaeon SCGC-AAA382N08 TaxID=1698285 RepID=A0A133VQS7_9EURY|nr:hypothetical protein AKJ56_00430 [candidate division MSBL1 archaeon SCGC-AAA382N08]
MEDWKEILAIWTAVGFSLVLSGIFLYYGRGIENPNNMTKFLMYGVFGIFSATALTFFRIMPPDNKNKITYLLKKSGFHEPEGSLFGDIDFIKNAKKFFLISFLACVVLGYFSGATGSFYTTMPEFQISATAELGLSVEPAVMSETLLFNGFLTQLPFQNRSFPIPS